MGLSSAQSLSCELLNARDAYLIGHRAAQSQFASGASMSDELLSTSCALEGSKNAELRFVYSLIWSWRRIYLWSCSLLAQGSKS